MTCHQLRHTCVTRLREAGMALEAVQAQAGHCSIESTRVYIHLANSCSSSSTWRRVPLSTPIGRAADAPSPRRNAAYRASGPGRVLPRTPAAQGMNTDHRVGWGAQLKGGVGCSLRRGAQVAECGKWAKSGLCIACTVESWISGDRGRRGLQGPQVRKGTSAHRIAHLEPACPKSPADRSPVALAQHAWLLCSRCR